MLCFDFSVVVAHVYAEDGRDACISREVKLAYDVVEWCQLMVKSFEEYA